MREFVERGVRALALLVVAIMIIPTASVLMKTPAVENASAAATDLPVKVGWLSDVQVWNPMAIEMVEDYVVTFLMYSCLFTYDQDWQDLELDLATGYYQVLNPDGTMSTYINITRTAYFRNAANPFDTSHQLTGEDVVYTFTRIMANPGGAWDWYLQGITAMSVTNPSDPFQVRLDTSTQMSTFIDNLADIPIIPEYLWVDITDSQFLGTMKPEELVGSGPFYYNSSVTGGWYLFTTAPNYHGATDYPVGDPRGERVVDIGSIMYVVYSDTSAMTIAMNDGSLDAIALWGEPNLYLNTLGVGAAVPITKYAVQEPGICDIAINAIPLSFRTKTFGTGNPILLDPVVREAIMMTLDKDGIVNETMFGLATRADSVVQPGYWQADIQNKLPYDPAAARALLVANGYDETDTDGILEVTADSAAYKDYGVAVGTNLQFRCWAPDTDPSYEAVGMRWTADALLADIQFDYLTKAESVMINQAWYQSDYDIWVWHWGWGPEPIGGALSCWLTNEITEGGDNCQTPMGPWWYGPDNYTDAPTEWGLTGAYSSFDQNISTAMTTMDKDARKVIVDNCQQMIYDSHCENPPFYDVGLYGISTARFDGWGNWSQHPGRTTQSDLLWVWFDMYQLSGNLMPSFNTPLQADYVLTIDTTNEFTVGVADPEGDPLTINWTFGDGTAQVQNTSLGGTTSEQFFTMEHQYTVLSPSEGYEIVVTAWDGNSGNTATCRATVYVTPEPDTVPSFTTPVTYDPATAYIDETVTWSVGATDAESSSLTITWDWDDAAVTSNTYTITPGVEKLDTQTHSWSVAGTYYVNVYIDDNSGLPGHNVSSGDITYEVISNTAPSEPIVSPINAGVGLWTECLATSTDADGDLLTFWWQWDDGSFNKSVVQSTAGVPAQSTVYHTWSAEGTYPVIVSVDDGNGHNVTAATAYAVVTAGDVPPSSLLIEADPSAPRTGETVTFTVSAIDVDSEALAFYVEFGDDASAVATGTAISTRQSATVTHAYDAAGDYTVTLYADDGYDDPAHNVSTSIVLTVSANTAPVLSIASALSAKFNVSFTVTPTSCSDADGDTITVWYEWGDGAISQGVEPYYAGTHVYEVIGEMDLTVWASDGFANTSATATVQVSDNQRPEFVGTPALSPAGPYKPGANITFTIVVKDYEGDTVNLTINFGDGSSVTDTFTPEADTDTTRVISHTYVEGQADAYTVTIVIDDGMQQFHYYKTWNTKTTSVTVEPEPTGISTMALVGIGAVIVIAALAVAYVLMKRKKKGAGEEGAGGGMEGMAPPEPPPPQA